jgi:hypothetical protein
MLMMYIGWGTLSMAFASRGGVVWGRDKEQEMAYTLRDEMFENFPKGGDIVEVGVRAGENAQRMLRILEPTSMVWVDPWGASVLAKCPKAYERAMKIADADPRIEVYHMMSPAVTGHFEDGQFDLVYIDGDHSYLAVLRDLFGWYPKIKTGGWLIGHDYFNSPKIEVKRAADEFCKRHDLDICEYGELQDFGRGNRPESDLPNFAICVKPVNLDYDWLIRQLMEAAAQHRRMILDDSQKDTEADMAQAAYAAAQPAVCKETGADSLRGDAEDTSKATTAGLREDRAGDSGGS